LPTVARWTYSQGMNGSLEFTLWDEWRTETQARIAEICHGENLLQLIMRSKMISKRA